MNVRVVQDEHIVSVHSLRFSSFWLFRSMGYVEIVICGFRFVRSGDLSIQLSSIDRMYLALLSDLSIFQGNNGQFSC